MVSRRLVRPVSLPALLIAAALLVLLAGRAASQGLPSGPATAYPAGWNMVSFADSTDFGPNAALMALYTYDTGQRKYIAADLRRVQPGVAYWAYFTDLATFTLLAGNRGNFSVAVPAGQCAMVGNPSASVSARVLGADRVYVYSPQTGEYIEETLLGIGRGAWACNDGAASATVSVVDQGNVVGANFPACCGPKPFQGQGQARIVFENDSPYPLTFAAPPIDQNGVQIDNGILAHGQFALCQACPEYTPGTHDSCNPQAESRSVVVPAGRYVLHIQSEGPSVPDLLATIELQANTGYTLCYFVESGRPM